MRSSPPYETYVEYKVYLAPGLVGMVLLFNGMQSSLAMVYDREMGLMRLLLTAPLPRWWLLLRKLLAGPCCRWCRCSPSSWPPGLRYRRCTMHRAASLAARCSCSRALMLAALGLVLSVYVKQLENFAGTMNFVIFPMFFISTALYPLWKLQESGAPGSGSSPVSTLSPTPSRRCASRWYGKFRHRSAVVVTAARCVALFAIALSGLRPAARVDEARRAAGGRLIALAPAMSSRTPELAAVLFRRTLLASAGVALLVAVGLGTLTVVNVRQEVRAARELVALAVQASRTNATTAQALGLPDLNASRMRGLRLRLVEEPGDASEASRTRPRSLLERLAERWFGVSDRFLIPLTDDPGGPALVVEGHAVGELQEQVFDMSIVLGALALAVVALGVGHGWVVRGVRDPLSDMTRAAASMAEGELSRRVPEPRIAEFASLARALNHLAQSLEQTRRMRRMTVELVNLREDERKSLARELHDDLGQRLAVIAAETHLLRASGGDSASVASIAAGIHSLQHSVRSILERLRQGQPMVLPELDAPAVLDDWRRREPAVRWRIAGVDRDLPGCFGDSARATLARVLQEALANAFRHAQPTQVSIRLVVDQETARLSITNDGIAALRGGCGAGHGILGMRERAHGSGGSLQAGPAAAGSWEVQLCLPVANMAPNMAPASYSRIAHSQPAPLATPASGA